MAIEGMERKQKSIITEIRGKIKNMEFRLRRDGRIEIGARRIPKQPLSPAQLSVREAYGKIYQMWTQLSEEEKQYYNSLGKAEKLSGWNVFFREKMKPQLFKVTIDCSGMSTNYTDYILIIPLSKYPELLNALNDDLTNLKVLDSDKQTELQFFRFVTKRESNNPILLIKIPNLPPGGYYNIFIRVSNRYNNAGTQGSNFFLFYDDFNDPALPSWTKTSELTVTVQNSKATFSSSFRNAAAYINAEYTENYQIIAKISSIYAPAEYAAIGWSDDPTDDLRVPKRSNRYLYFDTNKAYIYASNEETEDVCSNLFASIPSTYPAFARVINLYRHLIVQLNEKIASLANTNCVLDSYRRKPTINLLENTQITLDIFAIAKAYAPEPVIYEVKKIAECIKAPVGLTFDNDGGGTWNRYINIPITSAPAEYAQYKIKLDFDTISVYSADGTLKTQGTGMTDFWNNVKTDGADIRAFDNNKKQLYFYIESWDYANRRAVIWVRVEANITELNIAYGNSLATASSYNNPEMVFEFFDDFNGTELDTAKWATYGTVSVSVSDSKLSISTSQSKYGAIKTKTTFQSRNVIFEVRRIHNSGNELQTYLTDYDATSNPWFAREWYRDLTTGNNTYNINRYTDTDGSQVLLYNESMAYNVWRVYTIAIDSTNIRFLVDNVQKYAETCEFETTDTIQLHIAVWSTGNGLVDWVRVLKLADPASFGTPAIITI